MKYPWTALALIIIWLATTYIIINQPNLEVNKILLITLIGTIVIALIGFRTPTVGK
ncbi:MAG: hypothetical protein AAB589_02475 [Patescibacteria group bacterium]